LEKSSSSSSMPRGNRNCMRRRLFSYMVECRETWQEFQDLIDLGPSALIVEDEDEENENEDKQSKKPPPPPAVSSAAKTGEEGDDDDAEKDDDNDDDDGWFQFLSGQDQQQYTVHEIPVATAALALIKISRGALNLADQACEAVGERLRENDENDSNGDTANDNIAKERKQELLAWMETLHHFACAVGDGMTDLGATLYPPLQLLPPPLTEPFVASESETKSSSPSSPSSSSLMSPCSEVEMQIDRQANGAIAPLLNHVLDFAAVAAAAAVSTNTMDSSDLPETVVELATKLKENLSIRQAQALQAIVTAVASAA
jgi:Grap2 and cyclin-D-interacting